MYSLFKRISSVIIVKDTYSTHTHYLYILRNTYIFDLFEREKQLRTPFRQIVCAKYHSRFVFCQS